MVKFVFNPRTGMMDKKDDQIYFAQSQGGGLRIDDHKHNVKFIVNRDGTITNLSGISGSNVAIYDMRDAKIIAGRVTRMFGGKHKYTDYRMFLSGHRYDEKIIKSFEEFVGEGLLGDMANRDLTGSMKKEDGMIVGVIDGKRLVMPTEIDGDLVDFDGKKYVYIKELDSYFAVLEDEDDTYYKYNPELSGNKVNMEEWFYAKENLREHNFIWLRALIKAVDSTVSADDFEGFRTDFNSTINSRCEFLFEDGETYYGYEERDDAIKDAMDDVYDFLKTNGIDETSFKNFRDSWGNKFIDIDKISDALQKGYESFYDELNSEEKIDELLRYDVIMDDNDYFETVNGVPDHSRPTFDPELYDSEYAEARLKDMGDDGIIDEYFDNFGYDDVEYFVDYDWISQAIVDDDGPENTLASYDGKEREVSVDGETYYFYRKD